MTSPDLNELMVSCPFKHDDMTQDEFRWFNTLLRYIDDLERDSEQLRDLADTWKELQKFLVVDKQ